MADSTVPSVTAMVLCDQIIVEQGSGKKSLIGIFDRMMTFTLPTAVARMAVYVRVMDASGKYPMKLRLVKLKDETLIQEIKAEVEAKDPLAPTEVVINLMGTVLPEAGKYEFQFYLRDIYLHRVTMELSLIQGGPPWQQHPQLNRR
jgi:hypothetical protein